MHKFRGIRSEYNGRERDNTKNIDFQKKKKRGKNHKFNPWTSRFVSIQPWTFKRCLIDLWTFNFMSNKFLNFQFCV